MTTTGNSESAPGLTELFHAQRARLWGLAYRLTGTAEDAEDIVQEAFVRLMARPPGPGSEQDLGRWLSRVATNLGIDALRRRRRRRYVGPWLPTPIEGVEIGVLDSLPSDDPGPEARYSLAESATYAFMLALEVLSPRQRAVLLLRDVFGHSARETAERLATSEGGVRVLHLRARRALEAYDASRCVPTAEVVARHQAVLARFLRCLLAGDAPGVEAVLAENVETLTDAAGEYTALAAPLVGRERVARLYLMATLHRREGGVRVETRSINGLPAALISVARPVRRQAPRALLRCDLDSDDRIRVVHAILASRKLAALRPSRVASGSDTA